MKVAKNIFLMIRKQIFLFSVKNKWDSLKEKSSAPITKWLEPITSVFEEMDRYIRMDGASSKGESESTCDKGLKALPLMVNPTLLKCTTLLSTGVPALWL